MVGSVTNAAQASSVAAASTLDLANIAGNSIHITGAASITSFGGVAANKGATRIVIFDTISAVLVSHATKLILPTGADITTQAFDCAIFVCEGADSWRCVSYLRKSGVALA